MCGIGASYDNFILKHTVRNPEVFFIMYAWFTTWWSALWIRQQLRLNDVVSATFCAAKGIILSCWVLDSCPRGTEDLSSTLYKTPHSHLSGVTSILTMTFLFLDSRADLPRVHYPTALDVYLILCYSFVLGTILEFSIVHSYTKYGTGDPELRWGVIVFFWFGL